MTTTDDATEVEHFCAAVYPRLVASLSLHCGDRDVAAELAQEALARVWERWPSVRTMDSPAAWTFRVAFNLAASRFRRRAAERRALARLPSFGLISWPDTAEAVAVRQAVLALPARQRAVIVLRFFADLPVDAVATIVGCAPGTVKSLTSRARTMLRRDLGVELRGEVDVDHG